MSDRGFWDNLDGPIVGLAPMDGVTDAAFRHMVCKYSNPSVIYTEFTNVEGLARGAVEMLKAFIYEEAERPIVAQIYGIEVDSYYKATVMLAELGFDGIDINMGCPANKVAKQGSGAGLIKRPELAKEIIRICKMAAADWADGVTMKQAGVHPDTIEAVEKMKRGEAQRKILPVSVKTRIGYNEVVAEEWVKTLLEEKPALICMHGRTLKQMYTGEANWEVLAEAAQLTREAGVLFLGNGDVKSMKDAAEKSEKYGMDGVLVGRGCFGNPWFFGGKEAGMEDKLNAAVEHCRYMENNVPELQFLRVRKHLGWYCKGFDGAKELRMKFMKAESADEVEEIVKKASVYSLMKTSAEERLR